MYFLTEIKSFVSKNNNLPTRFVAKKRFVHLSESVMIWSIFRLDNYAMKNYLLLLLLSIMVEINDNVRF